MLGKFLGRGFFCKVSQRYREEWKDYQGFTRCLVINKSWFLVLGFHRDVDAFYRETDAVSAQQEQRERLTGLWKNSQFFVGSFFRAWSTLPRENELLRWGRPGVQALKFENSVVGAYASIWMVYDTGAAGKFVSWEAFGICSSWWSLLFTIFQNMHKTSMAIRTISLPYFLTKIWANCGAFSELNHQISTR